MIDERTPVIIGVGQYSERVQDAGYAALSHMDLAGRALQTALDDCRAMAPVAPAIDTLGAIRQFEISYPGATAPFGKSNNPPRSIAARVGADPRRAVLEVAGGQSNQQLLGEFAQAIWSGESDCAAIVGAEAISTVRTLAGSEETPDWSEEVPGDLEDRGHGMERFEEREMLIHGAGLPFVGYAALENARRARLGLSIKDYRRAIGQLFAPFTKVAAANPHAASRKVLSASEIAAIGPDNRILAEPYSRRMVSRDQVNQAAAIIVASAAKAREIGIAEGHWVHIHAIVAAKELPTLERPDFSRSDAATISLDLALGRAGLNQRDCRYLDFYSCFAIPVFNAIDHLGIAPDDPRGLTLTGGLPFFGGAGNNYSAHAIAEAVARCRRDPGAYALVGANGGIMGKYATGIYSTCAADWSAGDRYQVAPGPAGKQIVADAPSQQIVIETYTLDRMKQPPRPILFGRNERGERIAANGDWGHAPTRALCEGGMPFGARLTVDTDREGRLIARLAS